jgi:hypothetical protein
MSSRMLYGPSDGGRAATCSAETFKRIAAELGIEPQRTPKGARLYDAEQVARVTAERERRAREDRR